MEISLTDDESFLVEKIMKHKFSDKNKNLKSNLQFLIKWKGFKEPTWESWKNTSKLGIVHEYLRSHKDLKKFASKE
jgi:Chromo (CHRromatin Organisation MOdifier) domain